MLLRIWYKSESTFHTWMKNMYMRNEKMRNMRMEMRKWNYVNEKRSESTSYVVKWEILMQMRNMRMEMRNMWVICEWKYDTTLKELFKYEMSDMHMRMKIFFKSLVDENMGMRIWQKVKAL